MNCETLTLTPAEETQNLKEQNAKFIEIIHSQQRQISTLQRQINEYIKRMYGKKSEKLDPNQMLFEELILQAEKNKPASEQGTEIPVVIEQEVKGYIRRNHPGRLPFPDHLDRVEHLLDVPEGEKVCKSTGNPLKFIGNDITEKIDYKPSSLFVNRYTRPKYACGDPACPECGIVQHPTPECPIEKCEAESGLLAHIITEKYEHHMPLYRQELKFERSGVAINRKSMSSWMAKCALVLKPLYECMKTQILNYDIVLNDDTPVAMQEKGLGKTRKTRLWCSVGGEGLKYSLYNFTLGRGREGPLEFFNGYKGYFLADAYSGYNELLKAANIIYAACWAHARRYFTKAQDTAPKAATEILTLIAQLYKIESCIKKDDCQKRLSVRQEESVRYLNKIKEWLTANRAEHLPESPMRTAIDYTFGIWDALCVYTTDGRLPIDNNLAENGIRPIALGRKNWLFVGSENGGETAAILMTFCTTCRRLKVNTWKYLRDVLQRINAHPMSKIEELLPDRWKTLHS